MTHRYIKIGITTVVLVLAFAGLLWSTLRDGTEYYKNVDEVMPQAQKWEGKKLQLHGYVVPGTWVQKPNTLEYRFHIQNNPARSGQRATPWTRPTRASCPTRSRTKRKSC